MQADVIDRLSKPGTSHRGGCRFKGTRKLILATLLIPIKRVSSTSKLYDEYLV